MFLAEVGQDEVEGKVWAGRGGAEGERLLPWELGGEAADEAAGVAAGLAGAAERALLLGERELEEGVHAAVRVGEERRVDAVVHHLEEAVPGAGVADEPRHGGHGGGAVAGAGGDDAADVDERHVQGLGGVGSRALVRRPDELRRDVRPPAQHRRVEQHRLHHHDGSSTDRKMIDWRTNTSDEC